MKFLTWFSRIFVGVLFIISGLIKANDPIGFSIKLDEYFTVFGMEFLKPMSVFLSMFICVFEVACGVATLTGSKIRQTSWALLLMIVFFTFLTFYSAYFNKVTDCGCFGDALKLTPWQSFNKDLILLVFILIIFIRRDKITSMLSPKGDWIAIGLAFGLSTWFTVYCYNHLPIKDFRPYAVGKNLIKQMEVPPGAQQDVFETKLVYKNLKSGDKKEFSQEEYMKLKIWEDTLTWAWDTTLSKLIVEGYKPPIHDFKIMSIDGSTDVTMDVLNNPEYNFLLVAYNITKANTAAQPKINELANAVQKKGINFIGLTASPYSLVDPFRHENQNMFDYYTVDETALKTMIRSNPGLILLKGGTVIDMWHYNDIPSFEEVSKKYLNK